MNNPPIDLEKLQALFELLMLNFDTSKFGTQGFQVQTGGTNDGVSVGILVCVGKVGTSTSRSVVHFLADIVPIVLNMNKQEIKSVGDVTDRVQAIIDRNKPSSN